MATHAHSTPAPEIPFEWRGLWESASGLHPEAPDALHHAIVAGADPRELRLIQLSCDDAPAFWFGPRAGECAIYTTRGFAGTAVTGWIK